MEFMYKGGIFARTLLVKVSRDKNTAWARVEFMCKDEIFAESYHKSFKICSLVIPRRSKAKLTYIWIVSLWPRQVDVINFAFFVLYKKASLAFWCWSFCQAVLKYEKQRCQHSAWRTGGVSCKISHDQWTNLSPPGTLLRFLHLLYCIYFFATSPSYLFFTSSYKFVGLHHLDLHLTGKFHIYRVISRL
jgi:hypothetical protein